jgi:hypothetical protein
MAQLRTLAALRSMQQLLFWAQPQLIASQDISNRSAAAAAAQDNCQRTIHPSVQMLVLLTAAQPAAVDVQGQLYAIGAALERLVPQGSTSRMHKLTSR